MQMYPSYTLRDVLKEYAIVFFALLNEGYRLRYRHYLMLAQIAEMPMGVEVEQKRKFYDKLQFLASHPSDMLKTGDGSGTEELRNMLG